MVEKEYDRSIRDAYFDATSKPNYNIIKVTRNILQQIKDRDPTKSLDLHSFIDHGDPDESPEDEPAPKDEIIELVMPIADQPESNLKGIDLKHVNLSKTRLSNIVFSNCDFQHANFQGAVLEKVVFHESCNFDNTNFEGAVIKDCTFSNTNSLRRCNFNYTTIDNTSFGGTTPGSGADICDSTFVDVRFSAGQHNPLHQLKEKCKNSNYATFSETPNITANPSSTAPGSSSNGETMDASEPHSIQERIDSGEPTKTILENCDRFDILPYAAAMVHNEVNAFAVYNKLIEGGSEGIIPHVKQLPSDTRQTLALLLQGNGIDSEQLKGIGFSEDDLTPPKSWVDKVSDPSPLRYSGDEDNLPPR